MGKNFVKFPNIMFNSNSSIESIFYTRRKTDGETESYGHEASSRRSLQLHKGA